jgi:hypothetical protein
MKTCLIFCSLSGKIIGNWIVGWRCHNRTLKKPLDDVLLVSGRDEDYEWFEKVNIWTWYCTILDQHIFILVLPGNDQRLIYYNLWK